MAQRMVPGLLPVFLAETGSAKQRMTLAGLVNEAATATSARRCVKSGPPMGLGLAIMLSPIG